MVPKDKNSAASPAKKKEDKVPKEVVAHGVKEGPKAKAPDGHLCDSETIYGPQIHEQWNSRFKFL